jgi:hypothetical protein
MHKKLHFYTAFLVCMFLFQSRLIAQAQIWVQNNAVWHYDFDSFNGQFGFVKTEHVGDTLLAGYDSKVFVSNRYRFTSDINGIIHLLSITTLDTNYTWNTNDKVFYWRNNQFETLYDFTKASGEEYAVAANDSNILYCDSISKTTVISNGTMTIGSNDYATIEVQSDISSFTRLDGNINARYGNYSSSYMANAWIFPMDGFVVNLPGIIHTSCDTSLVIDYIHYKFRCFQDDSLDVNPLNNDCEYYLNHADVPELSKDGYLIYPNPAADFITIVAPFDQNEIEIYNVTGELVLNTQTNQELQELSLDLPKGTYILKVYHEQELHYSDKLIIH